MVSGQLVLFEVPNPVADEVELMRGFIGSELIGLDVSEEEGCYQAVDVVGIAAESIAQILAETLGGVDPESENLLSETITPRINQVPHPDWQLDIDVFMGFDRVDAPLVANLADRALALGRAAYSEAQDQNRIEKCGKLMAMAGNMEASNG